MYARIVSDITDTKEEIKVEVNSDIVVSSGYMYMPYRLNANGERQYVRMKCDVVEKQKLKYVKDTNNMVTDVTSNEWAGK